MEMAKVSVAFEADTSHLERGAKKAEGLVGGLGNALGSVGGLALGGAIAGVAGLGAGLVVAGKSAADFQSQISGIAAVGGAEAAARMSEISAKALQVGKDTSFSASEAAGGMEELIKAGVSISDVLGPATDAMTSLAAATGVGLADAAGIAANAMNQFHLEGVAVTEVADIIAGAANASAIDVKQFGLSLQSVGAVANLVGLSFKDTAVAIAEMGQAGIPASDAGTSLKTMLMSLQPATKKASEEFAKLGLITTNQTAVMHEAELRGLDLSGSIDDVSQRLYSSVTGWKVGTAVTDKQGKAWSEAEQELGLLSNAFFTAEGNAKPLAEIQGVLADATKNLTKQQQLASLEILFGSDAIRAAAVLADNGAEGFTKMADAMGKVSAADVAKTRLDNVNGSLEALKGSLEVASITIGTAMLPSLKLLVDGGIELLNANMPLIEQFSASLPGAMAAAGTFITGTLVPALSEVWKWLSETLPPALAFISGTAWPALVDAGTAVATKVGEITTFFSELFVELEERGVFTELQAAWTSLQEAGASIGRMFREDFNPQLKTATGEAITSKGVMLEFAGNIAITVKNINEGVTALKNFVTWLENTRKTALDASQVLSGFTGGNVLAGIQALGRLTGQQWMAGVGQGIEQGTPAVQAAASTAAAAVPDAFRDDWRMRSPSQVAIDQGFQYATSLAAGIAQGNNAVHEAVLAIVKNALLNNIDPMIALALAKAESGFNPAAVGDSGASVGLFQLHERGQGAGMGASRADPWTNAKTFLGNHGELFQQLKASGLAGEELAATFGRLAEVSDPQYAHRYATAYRELVAQFGATGAAAMALTSTTTQLSTAQQDNGVWAAEMADQQARFAEVLKGQVDPATILTTDAMKNFAAVLGPMERQVAGGAISMDTLQFKMVDLARATGLAPKPFADYSAGLIDISEAMNRVVLQSADAGPQFEAFRQQIGTTNAITDEATLQFLQLALNYGKVAPAATVAAAATTGLTTATGAAMNQIDPALMLQAADASRQMAEALGTADAAYSKVRESASQASSIIKEFLGAAQSLGSYLEEHTFDFKINIPEIPDWATPGSPMPIEDALKSLHSTLRQTPRVMDSSFRSLEMPVMAGRDGGGARGGDTYQINVTQQPGEDGNVFAKRVVAVLDQQRNTARRRG